MLNKNKTDNVYGIYFDGDDLKIGEKFIHINQDDGVFIGDTTFEGTRGLYELLFKKEPSPYIYSELREDLREYREILILTNVHRTQNSRYGSIKSNVGAKNMKIIRKLFPVQKKTDRS